MLHSITSSYREAVQKTDSVVVLKASIIFLHNSLPLPAIKQYLD